MKKSSSDQIKKTTKASGDTNTKSNNVTKIILELDKTEETLKTGPVSPIFQLDGGEVEEDGIKAAGTLLFNFKIEYREEDILYSLEKLFQEDGMNKTTVDGCPS